MRFVKISLSQSTPYMSDFQTLHHSDPFLLLRTPSCHAQAEKRTRTE